MLVVVLGKNSLSGSIFMTQKSFVLLMYSILIFLLIIKGSIMNALGEVFIYFALMYDVT